MDNEIRTLVRQIKVLGEASDRTKKATSQIVGSHGMTLDQSSQNGENLTEILDLTTRYQLTVKLRQPLTRRQIGLLLEILNYQTVYFGINFGMYLAMEHLSSMLIGQKLSGEWIKDENERRVVLVTQILLRSVSGKYMTIASMLGLPEPIIQSLIENKLIMERRVFNSRFQYWRPEEWLSIETVPLENIMERVKGRSERYSSYCKGYGESHPSAHRQKTKPNSELDGETEDLDFLTLRNIGNLLILTQLEMRAKYLQKFNKS